MCQEWAESIITLCAEANPGTEKSGEPSGLKGLRTRGPDVLSNLHVEFKLISNQS